MAASMGHSILLRQITPKLKNRYLFFHTHGLFDQFTYCRKVFYCRFIKEHASEIRDYKITKESKVDKSVSVFLEQSCVGSSGHVNYKRHPGVMRKIITKLPARLLKSVKVLMERYPVESLATKTQNLVRYLQGRHPPMSDKDIQTKAREVEQTILEKDGDVLSNLEGEEYNLAVKKLEQKVLAKLRTVVYHWQPMQYDAFTSYIYMMGRIASDYAVFIQCFTEIKKRDPEFKPTSVYNFGSRVGAGIWAADKEWKDIVEHYCVDSSGFMNTIARLLLQDGNEQNTVMSIKGVHFRQFAPSPKHVSQSMADLLQKKWRVETKEKNYIIDFAFDFKSSSVVVTCLFFMCIWNQFSLVVCPYMLMEQASDKDRLQLVLDLWEMTENYLVLIENGTTAGFSLIDEARDFLLQANPHQDAHLCDLTTLMFFHHIALTLSLYPQVSSNNPDSQFEGHVFSPCPHDNECPKKRDKKQPCLTECVSNEVDFSSGKASDRRGKVRYSFVILKKGRRESETAWPRVLQLNKATRHNHCHVCLPCGQLQHVVITKGKFEKHLYGCSKFVNQGDFLPVQLSKWAPEQEEADEIDASNSLGGDDNLALQDDRSGHEDDIEVNT